MQITPPLNLIQLLKRAEKLSGLTLAEVATPLQLQVPPHLRQQKGWVGQLLELVLGANAGNYPCQDFPHLGVELKTLPIDHSYQPLETTYVCMAHLSSLFNESWQYSAVRNKLGCVLWIPILATRHIPIAKRIVGTPFLWSPDTEQEEQLRQDWEEICEKIAIGEIESITARLGEVLQLRPKAANSQVTTHAIGHNGQYIQTQPRGFYLKKNFTKEMLKKVFQFA